MFYNMQQFGKWLDENNQVDFGKNVSSGDYILDISYDGNNFSLGSINESKNIDLNFYEKSCFNDTLFHSTDQNVIIPSRSNLLGFTPFFIKLDHDFKKRNNLNSVNIKKFKNKIGRTIKSNRNNKDFCGIIDSYYDNLADNFLNKCPFTDSEKVNFISLRNNLNPDEVKNLIISYYEFLQNNSDEIINKIIDFKESGEYVNKRSNFYVACVFGNINDLLNDFFYNYTKFLKLRSEQIKDYVDGTCAICGEKSLTYPKSLYYSLSKISSFNYSDSVKNSKLHLCNKCSSYIKYADDKLNSILKMPSILIIPNNLGEGDYGDFLKIANEKINSFKKINKFLKECGDFTFDLAIVNKDANNTRTIIRRYIENYKAYLVKFENLLLYDNNKMKYLFNEFLNDENVINFNINDIFGFEAIFKEFFYETDSNLNINGFYEIYTKDLTGNQGILKGFSSKTVSIFSMYCENIFSFIYEVNLDAINKKMINEIVLNSVEQIQKNGFNKKMNILKRLNYYFMLKKEFLRDDMLVNDNVCKLKKIFGKFNGKDIVFDMDDEIAVKNLIEEDKALKYYLLGQFIRYVDNFKSSNDKNPVVFSNFISGVNRNNIRKLFVTEVLLKNNFYINQMNKKGKFIFGILEKDSGLLFDEEENFDYEDYVLLLFTGYYTENILSKKYKYLEE